MSNRFNTRADPRNDLFSSYNRSTSPSKSKSKSKPRSPGYGYAPPSSSSGGGADVNGSAFAAYPGSGSASGLGGYGGGGGGLGANGGYGVGGDSDGTFRAATPNSRGQYSTQTLQELESQNEEQVGVLTGKVKMLKDLTHLIGDEIRDSSSLADKMNDQFETSRLKLRGTMTRMLRMAEKTGVGWKVWLGFFAAVCVLFWWVWLF
ncbi:hypothetical protein BDV95DRAFT_557179 [Massariosphaeria phaeospora]|uniref:t-SNARE coiled-coil homology domain-containing protein n=1 Tax=Massariosphaeria phaeospora TaxID=100035 RepID=A0A7C8IK15_9PLEO|nr:hypothetical protein BDV95DRAFT_557179 [Massariosphaeria phaeospora]